MPHVIVKLWPGKSAEQKRKLADRITRSVMEELHCGSDSVSVGFEEVAPQLWTEQVYKPDILGKPATILKRPGYKPV
jgi:4-oxalocrotonate tautomerase